MADAGFDFKELTQFQKDLLSDIKDAYPDAVKDFLKKEAKKFKKVVVKNSKTMVKKLTGNYIKGIQTGKVYKYGGSLSADTCIRVYNKARHAHLIETGHKTQKGGYVSGRHVLEASKNQFANEFTDDCLDFLIEFTEKKVSGK